MPVEWSRKNLRYLTSSNTRKWPTDASHINADRTMSRSMTLSDLERRYVQGGGIFQADRSARTVWPTMIKFGMLIHSREGACFGSATPRPVCKCFTVECQPCPRDLRGSTGTPEFLGPLICAHVGMTVESNFARWPKLLQGSLRPWY